MSEELALPVTGELVPLDEPARVARALHELRELAGLIAEGRRICEQALADEAARQGTKTLHLDGATATVSGGDRLQWDLDKLAELLEAGLPDERYEELVRTTVTVKVDGNTARRIEAAGNPTYSRIIDEARSYEPGPIRVTVSVAKEPTRETT